MTEWIQKATHSKKGALKRQLGYSEDHKIPRKLLREIKEANVGTKVRGHRVTPLLKKRAVFAYNIGKRKVNSMSGY